MDILIFAVPVLRLYDTVVLDTGSHICRLFNDADIFILGLSGSIIIQKFISHSTKAVKYTTNFTHSLFIITAGGGFIVVQ